MTDKPIEVLSTLSLPEKYQATIKAISPRIRLSVYANKDVESIPADAWQKAEVLLSSSRFLPKPEAVPNLKWVQQPFAGVENLLRTDLAHKPGLLMSSGSGTMIAEVGQYALMAILLLAHKMPELAQLQRKKEWGNNMLKELQVQLLQKSTIGIVGYGSIGREIARLLQPFRPTILAAKKDLMNLKDEGYTPEGLGDPEGTLFTRLYPIEALKGMLELCDYVVIALPHTPETHHLFNKEVFDAMKPGAGLINLARGGLVKDEDLLSALKSGKVGAAVLDVFDPEPLPADSPYWALPNVVVTPHIAGMSPENKESLVELFTVNLERYVAGLPILNKIDLDKGY